MSSGVTEAIPGSQDAPTITGTPDVGAVLTATPGTWNRDGFTYAYQWQRDGRDIRGATGETYRVTRADQGRSLTVSVTATSVDGSTTATSAAVTVRTASTLSVTTKPFILTTSSRPVTVDLRVRPGDASGDAVVNVAGRSVSTTVTDGRGSVNVGTLPRGVHLITATYAGSDTVSPSTGYSIILVLW